MEIGIDIEQNDRFVDKSEKFLSDTFLPEEIAYAEKFAKSHEHYCAFWCVKEAVIKAFGNLKLNAHDICTLHDENGKPFVLITSKLENALAELGLGEIKISISHAKGYTSAVCLLC